MTTVPRPIKCDVCSRYGFGFRLGATCLYCARCAAVPESDFIKMLELSGGDLAKVGTGSTTFVDGVYISFHDWAAKRLAET